jgi:hypothetical protein
MSKNRHNHFKHFGARLPWNDKETLMQSADVKSSVTAAVLDATARPIATTRLIETKNAE